MTAFRISVRGLLPCLQTDARENLWVAVGDAYVGRLVVAVRLSTRGMHDNNVP